MNPLYEKAKDVVLIRRTSDNKEFEEYPLILQPQSALVTDPTNDIQCFGLCALRVGFATSASYSDTSSFAWYALSASWANSASYAYSSSHAISASWAETASFAFEASSAYSAAYASDAISASYAYTASYAESASYGTNFYAPRVTASYVSASVAMQTGQLTASSALIRSRMIGTASYALNAFTAGTSAFATNAGTADLAVQALTASLATSASHAEFADAVIGTVENAISASYAVSASYEIIYETSSSYADFAKSSSLVGNNQSYIVANADSLPVVAGTSTVFTFGKDGGSYNESNLSLKGNLIGTASWASNATSASYSITASYASLAALSSMSLAVRGLNVVNVPPMPNSEIGWTVPSSTPAAYDAVMSIGANGTSSEGQTHALIHLPENNKIYGAGWYGSIYVFNEPDNDFTNVNSASFRAGNFVSAVVYASGSLYFINGSNVSPSTGSITRVNINNITSQSVIVQGLPGSTTLLPLVTDGNYLYTIGGGNIYKWDLSGSLIQSTPSISASVSVTNTHAGTISDDKQWAYFSTTNGTIFRVNTSDLTNYTASRHLVSNFPNCCFDASLQDDMCYLNGYLYHSVESNGNVFKINATDLTFTAYPASGNSFGTFTDGTHVYVLMGSEIWVYLNGDTDSGPIRFGVTGTTNELVITNAGRFVYSNWTTLNLYSYFLPITQLGINKQPQYALDVAGTVNANSVLSPYISASSYIETNGLITGDIDLYGTLTVDGTNIIRSSNSRALRIESGSIRVPTLSSSAALLGNALNIRVSQSCVAGAPLVYTRSLGTIVQDGMYRLTVAGTIGIYSGSTLQNQPKWQFLHTDRMGAYLLPQTPLTPITLTTPPNYDYAFSFGSDYIFQAVAGSTIEYYYNSAGAQMSSTDCSASFFTTTTLAQILSGSVTGSI